MNSPEREALRCYSADLVTAISAADPLGLALKLFSKNLVERATVEDVCLPNQSPDHQELYHCHCRGQEGGC